jgi:adenylate cyclase
MSLEIERKFLVKNEEFKKEAYQKKLLKQGYLNSDKNRTVRVRIADDKGFITIKGKSNSTETTRFEW